MGKLKNIFYNNMASMNENVKKGKSAMMGGKYGGAYDSN